jgi:hypothetical protein
VSNPVLKAKKKLSMEQKLHTARTELAKTEIVTGGLKGLRSAELPLEVNSCREERDEAQIGLSIFSYAKLFRSSVRSLMDH